MSLRFTNRGVKPILTITDLYQSSLSFRRFSRNNFANTSLLTNHDLLYKCQSGFRANHSCETILIKITYACRLEAMDNGLFTGRYDLRKAFDVLDHKLLLKELPLTPSNGSKVSLAEGKLSEPLGIHSGISQGGILCPALFLLFINDLPLVDSIQFMHPHLPSLKSRRKLDLTLTHAYRCGQRKIK